MPMPQNNLRFDPMTGQRGERFLSELAANPRAAMFARHLFGFTGGPDVPNTLHATNIANDAVLDDARVGFQAVFMSQLEKAVDPIEEVALTVKSNRRVEEYDFLGDLPGFEEWLSDRTVAGLAAFRFRLHTRNWANAIRIKKHDLDDDALGLMPAQIAGLATKARKHRCDMLVELLLNGFDGTAFPDVGNGLAYDGAFFFDDSNHLGGNDNKHTAALGANGVAAAELLLQSMTTFDGRDPIDARGTHIICGPKLEPTARKLLAQEYLATGESNPDKGRYGLLVSPRIRGDYDDYWFLADLSKPIKPVIFQVREEISTSATGPNSVPAFMRGDLLFGAEARYNVGYFEHRLIVGSTGAG